MSVGMPAYLYLQDFGSQVWAAFGHIPYQVGSSVKGKEWRDVDVRLMLPDAEYDAIFGQEDGLPQEANGKWVAFCLAFSELGKRMTNLPIDFQIQRQSLANVKYPHARNALFLTPLRMGRFKKEGV